LATLSSLSSSIDVTSATFLMLTKKNQMHGMIGTTPQMKIKMLKPFDRFPIFSSAIWNSGSRRYTTSTDVYVVVRRRIVVCIWCR